RRARPDLPLDGADSVEPDSRRAVGARGDRRGVQVAGDHNARAALQPDEAEPRRRAGPRPHHPRPDPPPPPRQPRVIAGPGRAGASLEYPQVRAGLILMMDRTFTAELNAVIVEKAVRWAPRGIVGIDIAGPRPDGRRYDYRQVAPMVEEARTAGLGVTIHVG